MKQERTRRYYINQTPKYRKGPVYDNPGEATGDYRKFKKPVSDRFIADMGLKGECPDPHNALIGDALKEEEIEMIKQTFHEEPGLAFNNKPPSGEYGLD